MDSIRDRLAYADVAELMRRYLACSDKHPHWHPNGTAIKGSREKNEAAVKERFTIEATIAMSLPAAHRAIFDDWVSTHDRYSQEWVPAFAAFVLQLHEPQTDGLPLPPL